MIYTVSFNPAIDCVMHVRAVEFGITNRCEQEDIYFGGKAINVSTVLTNLGCANVAWGFVAGFTGHALETALQRSGMKTDFIALPAGATRINVKLKGCSDSPDRTSVVGKDVETGINDAGPDIDENSLARLFEQLKTTRDGDMLVVSGGIARNLPADTYARILKSQQGKQVDVVVDATGDLLMRALPEGPFLIKPNDEEIAEVLGSDELEGDALIEGARTLQRRGAKNVLVSLGGEGSFLIDETGALHRARALAGTLMNSVGAGDSMVAGFVAGYTQAVSAGKRGVQAYDQAFAMAQACGSATAFSAGLATAETVAGLYARVLAGETRIA